MYIIVDDRNIVTGGYASSFDREGVTTTGIDPIEKRRKVKHVDDLPPAISRKHSVDEDDFWSVA